MPTWLKLLLIALFVAAGVAACHQRDEGLREEGRVEQRKDEAGRTATAQAAENRKQAATRAAQEKADGEHAQALAAAAADAARAADAATRLQRRVDALVAAARRQPAAAGAPAESRPGQPGPDPLDLLADLFSRADREAGQLAEYADKLRTAGQLCERDYDALTVTP